MSATLNEIVRVMRSSNAVAAGAANSNGNGFDMEADGGYDGVMFVAALGTLTATQVTGLKAQVSSDDGAADAYADLAGTATTAMDDADDNKMVVLDIFKPPERWVRPVVTRGTANAVIDGVIAIGYRGRSLNTSHDATVQTSKVVKEASEGTP